MVQATDESSVCHRGDDGVQRSSNPERLDRDGEHGTGLNAQLGTEENDNYKTQRRHIKHLHPPMRNLGMIHIRNLCGNTELVSDHYSFILRRMTTYDHRHHPKMLSGK